MKPSNNIIVRLFTVAASIVIFANTSAMAAEGVTKIKSAHNCGATSERLLSALKSKGMTVFANIDHAKGAESVGLNLRPTRVIIFGNPKVGTHLMKCAQSAGIDMPMKALISEDAQGNTWYSYNDPAYLAKRHGADDCEIVGKMSKALGAFAQAATSPK